MNPEDLPLVQALSPYDQADVITTSTVTYSFLGAGTTVDTSEINGEDSTSIAWTAAQQQIMRDIFDYYETITNLTFTEVTTGTPNIEYAQVPFLLEDTTGYSTPLAPGVSQIVIPTEFADLDDVTLIHETAHSLGLSHPFDGPTTIPGSGDFNPGPLGLNNELVTRMSYSPPTADNAPGVQIIGTPFTLGAADIAALQLLYGANTSTGLGDTSYNVTPGQMDTIWDNGGTDTIDFSAATTGTVIDLRAATLLLDEGGGGYLSYIQNADNTVANGGFTIAFGVEIENAVGGTSGDSLTGNAMANTMTGGAGNDMLNGGAGLDTALYSGDQRSYTLTISADSTTLQDRRGTDGTDTLASIESLVFGDNTGGPFDLSVFGGAQNLTATQMESFVELYIAYFNRAPDAIGINFWGTAFANGTTLEQMATLFIDQEETRATYPEGQSTLDFATAVYNNVLGRTPDEDGLNFWVGVLDDGSVTRDQFILSVLQGAKAPPPPGASTVFVVQQILDQGYLENKTDVGAYYSITRGLSDVADATAAMALFDGTAASITAAQNAIDGYYTSALDADTGAFLMPLVGVIDDPFAGGVV